jgi:DNA-directed RNA polymerase omega subunit
MEEMDDPNVLVDPLPDLPEVPAEPAPPIESRFLFVDVAAQRAKQLRRGARARFEAEPGVPPLHKPERLAMEEVRRGLVYYQVPDPRGSHSGEQA